MQISNDLLEKLRDISRSISEADYVSALRKAERIYKENPGHIAVRERYATILADASIYTNLPNRPLMKKKSLRIFKSLMKSLKGLPLELRGNIRNEYYFHSGQYKKQYTLGVELVKKGDKSFYFSQGVGASWYAYQLYDQAKVNQAKKWARKSVNAWKKYLDHHSNYYYPYVNLAFAFGILGDLSQMENNLKKAQKLSGKPKTYFEFSDVRKKIENLSK